MFQVAWLMSHVTSGISQFTIVLSVCPFGTSRGSIIIWSQVDHDVVPALGSHG